MERSVIKKKKTQRMACCRKKKNRVIRIRWSEKAEMHTVCKPQFRASYVRFLVIRKMSLRYISEINTLILKPDIRFKLSIFEPEIIPSFHSISLQFIIHLSIICLSPNLYEKFSDEVCFIGTQVTSCLTCFFFKPSLLFKYTQIKEKYLNQILQNSLDGCASYGFNEFCWKQLGRVKFSEASCSRHS